MSHSFDPKSYLKPKQNIPESKKNEEWGKNNLDWIISNSTTLGTHNPDKDNFDLYNGHRDEEKWEHITKTYGIEFPAGKIKHIPLVRPNLNELHGEAKARQLNYTVLSADNDSISAKMEQISNELLQNLLEMIVQNEPVDTTLGQLEKYYGQDFKTEIEIAANHVLEDFILNNRLKDVLDDSLLYKFITGKEYYMVDVNRIGEDPIFKVIRPGTLVYANNDVKWIKDCDWAVHRLKMTPVEILDKFGDSMKDDDVKKLEQWEESYIHDIYKLDSPWDADRLIENADEFEAYHNNHNPDQHISVYYGQWKSIRKITYVESPNKYVEDAPFIKILETEDAIEEVRKNPKRAKNIKEKYIQDLWHGIRIGDDIYVRLGKVKYPIRTFRNPSKVQLSFNGLAFNSAIKPYSLIEITKDIQDLYDVMHWHKENLVALSGVKGSFMELSQIPDFGTGKMEDNIKMWFYYKKMGAAFLDRSKRGADKSYNQFQQYDDTLGTGLEAIIATIQHLEELAGRIIGVNRQRMGAVTQRDGKGLTDQAIFQSSLITEPIFAEHDEFVREALTDILHACRVAYKNGYTSAYLSSQYEQKIFTVNPEFSLADYNIYVGDASKDKRAIDELKAFVYQQAAAGMAEVEDIFPLFRKSSLKDIEETVKANIARRKAVIEQQQQQMQQMQMQLEQAKTQGEMQKMQAEIAKLQSEVQENYRKLELEQESLEIDREYKQGQLEMESKRIDLEAKQLDLQGKAKEVRDK